MKKWLAILVLLAAAPVQAAVFEVTKTADTLDGACNDDCSLREAVTAANARKGLDVVRVGPGVYALTRTGTDEDASNTGDLDVRDELVILGAGADRTILDGAGADRVLEVVTATTLEVRDATIRNGRAVAVGPFGFPGGLGGGVYSDSSLTLVRCVVTGNVAALGGGVAGLVLEIRDSTLSDNEANLGGGLFGLDTVRMSDSTVSGNRATVEGGGLSLPLHVNELSHLTVTGNQAPLGGGIAMSDGECPGTCIESFFLRRSVVAGNSADDGPDCVHLLPSGAAAYNVFGVDDGGCRAGAADRSGTAAAPLDPRLSPLGDHGGPTPTHLPLPDSPAVGLVAASQCSGDDQRGEPRPAGCDAGAVELSAGCVPGSDALCLGAGGRFQVTATWAALGTSGAARTLPLTQDTGAFWFFSEDNLEIQIKVLDGCAVNQRFWVFATGLTDVGVEVTVTDTVTGESWMYGHAAGTTFPTVTDTNAFATCLEEP